MGKEEFCDRLILSLREKYREQLDADLPIEECIQVGRARVKLERTMAAEGKCSLLLPEIMTDMPYPERAVKYQNSNRPREIKTERSRDATFTFDILLPDEAPGSEGSLQDILVYMQHDMGKIWKQMVFYDKGCIQAGEAPVAWMDFKISCLDGPLYGLVFLYGLEDGILLGNFHCSFPKYDTWKPVVLKLLTTLKTEQMSPEEIE